MCNCIKELKNRLMNELPKLNPSYSALKITSVSLENEALIFGKTSQLQLSIPVTLHHEPVGRKTKTAINIMSKFCSICGEAYDESEVK